MGRLALRTLDGPVPLRKSPTSAWRTPGVALRRVPARATTDTVDRVGSIGTGLAEKQGEWRVCWLTGRWGCVRGFVIRS